MGGLCMQNGERELRVYVTIRRGDFKTIAGRGLYLCCEQTGRDGTGLQKCRRNKLLACMATLRRTHTETQEQR